MDLKPKGKFIYEVVIAVLAIALILTILYPANVWKLETEEEQVCQARMEAIQMIEYRYFPKENGYTDSIPKLIASTLMDSTQYDIVDSLVNWDYLVK